MNLEFHKDFQKRYIKLRAGEKLKFQERQEIFLEDPSHPILNNHALKGKYEGYRSINIGGNLRAIYHLISSDTVLFVDIDTHSNLYT